MAGRKRAAIQRPRDERGRWLSNRQIAARRGVQTKRRLAKERAKGAQERYEAAVHGQKARERTERRLTPAQREARRKDAERIERKERRQRKKASETTTATKGRSSSTRSGKSIGSSKNTTATRPTGKKSKSKRRPTSKAAKSQSRTLTFEFRGGSGDALKVQIAARVKLPAGMEPSNQMVYEGIAHRIDEGADHPVFKTRIIRWQNPGRKSAAYREWRQGNQADAWATLGPAIRASIRRAIGI